MPTAFWISGRARELRATRGVAVDVGRRPVAPSVHHRSESIRKRLGGRGGRSADPAVVAVLRVQGAQRVHQLTGRRQRNGRLHAGTVAPVESRAVVLAVQLVGSRLLLPASRIHGSTTSKCRVASRVPARSGATARPRSIIVSRMRAKNHCLSYKVYFSHQTTRVNWGPLSKQRTLGRNKKITSSSPFERGCQRLSPLERVREMPEL